MPASTSMAVLFAAFVGLLAGVNNGANAQTYPNGPVKLIVPVPAGGVTDTMARILAQRLTEAWGQLVVVDNRPGGNYAVGAQAVARSPADGLTLLVAPDSTVTANPHLFSKLPYDPVKDLTPISVLCRITPVLVINPSLDVKSVPELIALAKAKPGSLNYGSYGIGTYAHLSMEDFKQRTGTDIVHIPYRGAAPAATALLAGDVSMLLLNLSSIEEHEKTGKVRILAVASEKRAALRPDYPPSPRQACPVSPPPPGSRCGAHPTWCLSWWPGSTPMSPRFLHRRSRASSSAPTASSASISPPRNFRSSSRTTSSIGEPW